MNEQLLQFRFDAKILKLAKRRLRCDDFAAGVSHAGISNIASYWGDGWWGFLYGQSAMPGSYPWNNPEMYTQQSPLFSADAIDAPLLLIHGDADINVPEGESSQMFTALQVLGKDVEYLRWFGEGHSLRNDMEHDQLAREMTFEWLDMILRDRPEAWEARFEGFVE